MTEIIWLNVLIVGLIAAAAAVVLYFTAKNLPLKIIHWPTKLTPCCLRPIAGLAAKPAAGILPTPVPPPIKRPLPNFTVR